MPNNRFKNSEVAFCIIHFKNQKSLIIIFTLIGQRMSDIDQRMKNDEVAFCIIHF